MKRWLQNSFLAIIACFLAFLVFIADCYTPPNLAFGVLYSLVVLYCWLLPWNYVPVIAGIICSLLILFAPNLSSIDLNGESYLFIGLNRLISMVVVWVSVTLVSISRRSFSQSETMLRNMEDQIEQKTIELQTLNQTLESEVKRRTEELKVKNEELQQFAYVASHDLKEPLNTIDSFISLINKEKTEQFDEDTSTYFNYIRRASRRMGKLIEDLLEFSRLGTYNHFQKVNCNQLLEDLKKDLHAKIKESQASISIGKLPVVNARETELRLLFQNLIQNAIKFKKEDQSVEIDIRAEETPSHWLFSVQDNGIGIKEKHQDRIFTIFKRLHGKDQFEGTGIGLAHCQKIVKLHGGKIWVSSEFNKGSTFKFTIAKEQTDEQKV